VPGEVPSDVPPAAFGRFRVLHQIGAGSLGPVFRGEDPDTGQPVAIKQLRLNLPPARAREVSEALLALVGRVADHPCLARVLDAGLYEVDPYVVTTFSAGESLDVALREYGPAAITDALPRLRGLAEALDQAAAAGIWHGSLHPRDIVVSARETQLLGLGIAPVLERAGVGRAAPRRYTAPEVLEGQPTSPVSDQYALAVIAHEWLFGEAPEPPVAAARLSLLSLPDVDSDVLAAALSAGLAADPVNRFPSSTALVAALEAALSGPLHDDALSRPLQDEWDSGPAIADFAGAAELTRDEDAIEPAPPALVTGEVSRHAETPAPAPVTLPSRIGTPASSQSARVPRGGDARRLAALLLVGLGIGGIAGYLLGTTQAVKGQPAGRGFTDAPVADPAPAIRDEVPVAAAPAPAPPPPTPAARDLTAPSARPDAAPAARLETARLLVRSTPAGATVTVDGAVRGVTPLALRELELGTRTIVVSRPGYAPIERRITLTADRPSRSLEVALTAGAFSEPRSRAGAERNSASTTGSLVIDSRPMGAAVTIDGQPAGTTPLTLTTLSPGGHSVRIERSGYRPWTTTVDVKAGERSRVAASLVGVQGRE
jgi:serine/threonine protein kinase